eukprot:tig00000607_g2517.t1
MAYAVKRESCVAVVPQPLEGRLLDPRSRSAPLVAAQARRALALAPTTGPSTRPSGPRAPAPPRGPAPPRPPRPAPPRENFERGARRGAAVAADRPPALRIRGARRLAASLVVFAQDFAEAARLLRRALALLGGPGPRGRRPHRPPLLFFLGSAQYLDLESRVPGRRAEGIAALESAAANATGATAGAGGGAAGQDERPRAQARAARGRDRDQDQHQASASGRRSAAAASAGGGAAAAAQDQDRDQGNCERADAQAGVQASAHRSAPAGHDDQDPDEGNCAACGAIGSSLRCGRCRCALAKSWPWV